MLLPHVLQNMGSEALGQGWYQSMGHLIPGHINNKIGVHKRSGPAALECCWVKLSLIVKCICTKLVSLMSEVIVIQLNKTKENIYLF